ncbi:ATP-binding cassette subfamily B protein [Nocardiopsis composta]|uniref:ATP-binding cassette subfamily B protein n=1 Tax=Nocardiopsis composta TaxID=157465 RepID=A0A7W8QSZ1_9ACTN|nr:ATP-binding cassette subfamily B protein [Nocardiopsis composta]
MSDSIPARPDPSAPPGPPPGRFPNLRLLWSFLHPHRRTVLLGLVLALVGSALELATPMVTKLLLDNLSADADLRTPILLLLGLLVVGGAVGMWHWVLLGTLAERVILDARGSLVRRYFRASLVPLTRRSTGELVTRVTSDTVLLREAASTGVVNLINSGALLIGTLVMMAVLDLPLLGVTAAAVAVVTVLFLLLMPAIARAQERAQDALGRMGGLLDGSLRAIRTVKVARAEQRITERIGRDAEESARYGISSVRHEAAAWTIAGTGIQLAIIAILGVGAMRITTGGIEVSTLVAFLLYAFTLLNPVTELSQSLTSLQAGVAAARRIRETETLPLEPGAEPAAGPGPEPHPGGPAGGAPDRALLELRGVTARYAPGAEPALRGVDLAVPARGHTAIVGPSGAGKTTVLSLMLRFLEPEEGRLYLDGVPYSGLTPGEVRRRFAYVEQDTPVLPGTIRENLLFSRPDAGEEELRRVLGEVRLTDKIDALEEGLDTPLGSDSLSGGQRQRIALARALLHAPDVLLLDEATAQIDAITEAAVTRSVRRHADRAAVVTIAHRLSTVIHADRIVVLENGRVRAQGTHTELLRSDELYRDLVAALHIAEEESAPARG